MTLKVIDGTYGYPKGRRILDKVSFEVPPGRLLAVLGPNGVGKTTLLHCTLGLLPWTSGRTEIDGMDAKTLSPAERWQRFAFVPQARNATTLALTGLDMVVIGRSAHLGVFAQPSADDVAIAEAQMERIGISHLRDEPCAQMSGGQFQMILIARALTADPTVLVLDEPETGLDFRNQLIVLDLLESLVHDGSLSVIMNTHYPTHALRIADDVLVLSAEHTHVIGSVEEIITTETLAHAFGVHTELVEMSSGRAKHRAVIPLSIL